MHDVCATVRSQSEGLMDGCMMCVHLLLCVYASIIDYACALSKMGEYSSSNVNGSNQ